MTSYTKHFPKFRILNFKNNAIYLTVKWRKHYFYLSYHKEKPVKWFSERHGYRRAWIWWKFKLGGSGNYD